MEIVWDAEIDLENMNSIEILKNQYCFIIRKENSKVIISLSKFPHYIHENCKNKEKIDSNIFYAFIDYKKQVNVYEIIIRLYNNYEKGNNPVEYINYLLKMKRLVFNKIGLNIKNIFKEIIYIQLNSIFIKSKKFNIFKDNLKKITLI